MTIAVVSILAPKLPTKQSHRLATNKRYVAHLIEMINENLDNLDNGHDNFNNFTVKFTLSALWNLTGVLLLYRSNTYISLIFTSFITVVCMAPDVLGRNFRTLPSTDAVLDF